MYFTSQKKFWEGYKVSPTVYSYTFIIYCSVLVRKEESSNGWKIPLRAIVLEEEHKVGQSCISICSQYQNNAFFNADPEIEDNISLFY